MAITRHRKVFVMSVFDIIGKIFAYIAMKDFANFFIIIKWSGDSLPAIKKSVSILYDQMTTPNRFLPRTRPSRKHNMQILLNFPKDGTRGVQAKSFYYRSISIWNDLPNNVVNSASINTFKQLLDEAWCTIL